MKGFRAAVLAATAFVLAVPTAAPAQGRAAPGATATLRADTPGPTYDRRIFTQFAEHLGKGIYDGLWVGPDSPIPNTRGFRNDVIAALRNLAVPVIRWPGGCFADEYHWREGVGPRKDRPVKINTHWGGVTEPNTVGTHEFMELVGQIGAEAYVAGNVGNGSPQEMAEWVEYMTSPAGSLADERARNGRKAPWAVPYFGIGNELWGCGGNMRPEYAADLTRRYATFVKAPKDTRLLKIAAGANVDDYKWTETMIREAKGQIDALSLHYYTIPGNWPPRGNSAEFDEDAWAETMAQALRIDELVAKHAAIMDKYDPEKKIFLAVDEWGTWYATDPGVNPGFLRQHNTLRDALVAAIHLNVFAKHADRVKMSAIAQMVNVLQAMVLTDGAKIALTPTYQVFMMYKPYMDATVLPMTVQAPGYTRGKWSVPSVSASAVRDKQGVVHVALANLDPNRSVTVSTSLTGVTARGVSGQLLTAGAMNATNGYGVAPTVAPVAFNGARLSGRTLTATLPAKSVVMLDLK